MKIAILADTHAGVRNNSKVFLEHQLAFFQKIFFPYCQSKNIKHLVHLGDVFDRRKETNNYVLHEWDERVFSAWNDAFESCHILIGNHDTYFKNTNSVNTPERFFETRYDSFRFHVNPHEDDLFGVKTLFLPWICEDNEERARQLLENSDASLVLGHLEIIGSPMFRGIENIDKGFEASVFNKFKKVLSGHFHIKSNQKNIHYLGSPYATMWSEALDNKGFHILDTKTLKLSFVENPHNPFVHIEYDGESNIDLPELSNKIVRILVKSKTSDTSFLEFLEMVEGQSPAEVNVTEQQVINELRPDTDENMDIFSLMDVYVDSLQFESSKEELKKTLRSVYHEAVNLHDINE
jgi:DNA repair exonuclease SbcCD nuclease subunit